MTGRTIHIFLALILFVSAVVVFLESAREKTQGDSEPWHHAHTMRNGTPKSARRAFRGPGRSITVISVNERFLQALESDTVSAVYQRIEADLSRLEAEDVLTLLDEADLANEHGTLNLNVTPALFDALWKINREVAAKRLLGRRSLRENDHIRYRIPLFFADWMREVPSEFISWLDRNRQDLMSDLQLFSAGEIIAITALTERDAANGMERVQSLPAEQARKIVSGVFSQRLDFLPPDRAISFLRTALSQHGHEEIVGHACGTQLYDESESSLMEFFERHTTTREEGEAILFQVVKTRIQIGLGPESVGDYLQSVRAFSEARGFRNANDLAAVILGVTSDRDHDDERAVSELLSYEPGRSALEIFLAERGDSMDDTQRRRVTDRLELFPGPLNR